MSDTPNSPFRNKTFVQLFAAQVTSLIGSGFTQVALALLAFDLMGAQAAVVLGIVWSVRVLAFVIFAPIFGGMAHKLPRKEWIFEGLGRHQLGQRTRHEWQAPHLELRDAPTSDSRLQRARRRALRR